MSSPDKDVEEKDFDPKQGPKQEKTPKKPESDKK